MSLSLGLGRARFSSSNQGPRRDKGTRGSHLRPRNPRSVRLLQGFVAVPDFAMGSSVKAVPSQVRTAELLLSHLVHREQTFPCRSLDSSVPAQGQPGLREGSRILWA